MKKLLTIITSALLCITMLVLSPAQVIASAEGSGKKYISEVKVGKPQRSFLKRATPSSPTTRATMPTSTRTPAPVTPSKKAPTRKSSIWATRPPTTRVTPSPTLR